MLPCSAWMRRPRFRRWTESSIQCCHSHRDAERHGFEYYRHGTLSLYAALDVKTGQVQGMTAGRHTSKEFIAFLEGLVQRTGWAKQIHVVLDNLSTAHKTQRRSRDSWLSIRKCRFHFTPTYSSWLNQVELWFADEDPTGCHPPRRVYPSVARSRKRNSAVTFVSIPNQQSRSVGLYRPVPQDPALTKSPGQLTRRVGRHRVPLQNLDPNPSVLRGRMIPE